MKGWMPAAFLVLGACLESSSLVCPDGTICGSGLVCAPESGCAEPDQIAACGGLEADAPCEVDEIPGVCTGGVCVALVCGDGVVSGNEQCDTALEETSTCRDRGFYSGGTIGCAANCSWNIDTCSEFCGDGILQVPEELCEIEIEPEGTCGSFGFDAGRIDCAGCAVDFAACRVIGWSDAPISAGVGLAVSDLARAGDGVIAVGVSLDDGAPFAASWRGTWTLLGELDADLEPAAVWAIADDRAWMTGRRDGGGGFVGFWDGDTWLVDDIPGPGSAVFARDPDQVFVLSQAGVRAWDGAGWSYTQLAPGFDGTALWGAPEDGPIYAAGTPGGLFRFEDGEWSQMEAPGDLGVLDVIGTPDGGLWAASLYDSVYRWDGSQWLDTNVTVFLEKAILALDGDGTLFLLAAWSGLSEQQRYTVFEQHGQGWRAISEEIEPQLVGLSTLAFAGFDHQMFAFGDSLGFRYGGSSWWDVSSPGFSNAISAWARGDELFVVSQLGAVHHRDAGGWTETGVVADQIDGAGSDVYALDRTNSELSHWDGDGWTNSKLGVATPTDLAVRGPDDVYLITNTGSRVMHWNGTELSEVATIPNGALQEIHCAEGGACAAAGTAGSFWSSEGIESPADRHLFAVWVAPSGAVVTGGEFGSMWIHDGDSWRPMETELTGAVLAIAGTSETDVFAALGLGLVHYDGNPELSVHPVRIQEDSSVHAFAVAGDTPILIGGNPAVVRLERTYPW